MTAQVMQRPFMIYYGIRPQRIAFLIDPNNCPPEQLDALFETNYGLWGGRYNPIIPVQDGTIQEGYWSLLIFTDPDIIYSYVDLPAELVDRIDRAISPLQIQRNRERTLGDRPWYFPSMGSDQVKSHLLATEFLAQQPPHPIRNKPFALSVTAHDWPSRRFVGRNFWLLDENLWPSPLPEGYPRFVIEKDWTDVRFLIESATARPMFPSGLSEFGTFLPEPKATYEHDCYCLLVGNDLWTWLYFWNKIFLSSQHFRSQWTSMCLPTDRVSDSQFVGAVSLFLASRVYRSGNNPARVRVISSEIPLGELQPLSKALLAGVDGIPDPAQVNLRQFPIIPEARIGYFDEFERGHGPFRQGPLITEHQAHGSKILLHIPSALGKEAYGERILDVKIEYRPERTAHVIGPRFWWKLPKVLGITQYFARNRVGRAGPGGLLSLQVGDQRTIEILIPDDLSLVEHPLVGRRDPPFTDDLRSPRIGPFRYIQSSDKGLYVRGVLGLFGGNLSEASRFFSNRYWRGVVEFISRRDQRSEALFLQETKNWLGKRRQQLIEGLSKGSEETLEAIAWRILNLARRQHIGDEELRFEFLLDRLVNERKEFVAANKDLGYQADVETARQDLKERLQRLTERQVFFQGIRPRCENCGSSFWYELHEVRQQRVECKGCRVETPVSVESPWFYRLNSLVRNVVAFHGGMAVITSLAALDPLMIAAGLIFDVGLKLYGPTGSGPSVIEVDFVAVQDGRLLLGEVKTNAGEFESEDFVKLVGVAKTVEAKVVALGALYDDKKVMGKHEQTLRSMLVGTEIETRLLAPRRDAFEPTFEV